MIAKNYIKYPDALRFQCEMFSNGYHNSPRIMRLIEVVFSWTPDIPAWWQTIRNAQKLLVKGWTKMQIELIGKKGEVVTPEAPMNPIKTLLLSAKANLKISLRSKCNVPGHAWTGECQEYQSFCAEAWDGNASHMKRPRKIDRWGSCSPYWSGVNANA